MLKRADRGTIANKATMVFILALQVLLCQTVFADEKTRYQAARELVSATYDIRATLDFAREGALAAVKGRFEDNPKTRDYSSVLVGVVMEVVDAYFHDPETQDKIKAALVKIYMEEFTEPELRETLRYYRTPAGRKILQKLPIVMQKSWQKGSEIGGQAGLSPKYQQMLQDKVKALQDKGELPKHF